ncbi:MAG: hypothetical protein LUE27_10995 [Clostridia bacterium]|nr:hypothetical protein [Clostridia bacterium]
MTNRPKFKTDADTNTYIKTLVVAYNEQCKAERRMKVFPCVEDYYDMSRSKWNVPQVVHMTAATKAIREAIENLDWLLRDKGVKIQGEEMIESSDESKYETADGFSVAVNKEEYMSGGKRAEILFTFTMAEMDEYNAFCVAAIGNNTAMSFAKTMQLRDRKIQQILDRRKEKQD